MSVGVRLDKWLWAARFYKTRALAAAAVAGGKVHVNGARAKPGNALRVGDAIRVRNPPYEWHVTVRELSERRGPAAEAIALYEETPESRRARETLVLQLKLMPSTRFRGSGRPSKKDRREITRLKREDADG